MDVFGSRMLDAIEARNVNSISFHVDFVVISNSTD